MFGSWSRRRFLQTAAGAGMLAHKAPLVRAAEEKPVPRFLIVLCATGGASIVDSFLAVRESESKNAAALNTYPDRLVQNVPGAEFRAIDLRAERIGLIPASFQANQSNFVKKHARDMMVFTHTGTSVNHRVAEHRAVTGNAAWRGRTLQEAVALQYGAGYPIPNVHLVNGTGFTERGTDKSLPAWAYGEHVAAPNLWPLSLDGYQGVPGAPSRSLFEKARAFRNQTLDPKSPFYATFRTSKRLQHWIELRDEPVKNVEKLDLITKLMLFPDSPKMPLAASGLRGSELGEKVRAAFPRYYMDPLESQAALAFLLLRYGVSVTVTLGAEGSVVFKEGASLRGGRAQLGEGGVINTPIAFDYSHQAHRETQALMWDRILSIADRLITLLKSEEFAAGQSFWDRTMIYVATDFGRTRRRPEQATSFGSGHDLNNGSLIISPFANGGKLLGGVDPDTLLTYGFDPQTGKPEPGRTMTEAEIYAGLARALGIDLGSAQLPDMRAMRRHA
ncbi:MAG: hypothetical protein NZV14_15205 [Bryobacteraceae bacterium]|nr:hypothetical protein [Bryobacteraceae bacterium]MDW8379511.1 hypothetical protein [Bryobacterales bacterium]